MSQSEFGKGLVICLVKFSEHFSKFGIDFESYKGKESESRIVEMWANAASDHLYEIEVPKGKSWDKIRKKVRELKETGLEMGHGYIRHNWTKKDVEKLMSLTREIGLMIDKKIGLKPDIGEW